MSEFTPKTLRGFLDLDAARDWARTRKASRVAQGRDHVAEVLDGKTSPGVLSDSMSVLTHEGIDDAGRSVIGATDIQLADEEGDGHA